MSTLPVQRPQTQPAGGGAAVPGGAPADEATPPSLADRLANASVLAMVVSLVFHTLIVAVAAVVTVGIASAGRPGARADREFEITITPTAELTGFDDRPIEADAPSVADVPLPEVATEGISDGAGGVDAPGAGSGLGAIGEELGGAGGGDIGDGKGLGGAGGGSASFFGVEARGSRFAYVVDVSGSMQGEKIEALKANLRSSIGGLLDHMSYAVVPFSSDAKPLGNKRKWTDGTQGGKRWGVSLINDLQPDGGTMPWPGFEIVFAMKPAPDAIYFMTDGNFDPIVADQIARVNVGSRKVPIHCITFYDKDAEELMRRIAAQSGGSYTHVKGP